jgi:hypothetical protein
MIMDGMGTRLSVTDGMGKIVLDIEEISFSCPIYTSISSTCQITTDLPIEAEI